MTFVPIRHVQLESKALAQQLGTPKPTPRAGAARLSGHDRARDRPVERGLNVANHFDFEHLPGRKYDLYWDPEGLLSTAPGRRDVAAGHLRRAALRRAPIAPARRNSAGSWPAVPPRAGGGLGVGTCSFPS